MDAYFNVVVISVSAIVYYSSTVHTPASHVSGVTPDVVEQDINNIDGSAEETANQVIKDVSDVF